MIYLQCLLSSVLLLSVGINTKVFAQEKGAQSVVAEIEGRKITLDEFNRRYDEIKQNTLNPPSKDLFLEDLVRYEVGYAEGKKKKVENDPLVAERIRQEIYKGLIEKELGAKIEDINRKISDSDLKKYYSSNPEIRVSHILIEFKPNSTEGEKAAAKKRAEEIYSEVKKSKKPFEELAALYTDDSVTKPMGGDLGYHSRLTLVPELYENGMKMKVGEMKGPIASRFGFHILKITDKRSFEKAEKRPIRAAVFNEKRVQLFDNYFKDLKQKYSIKTNKNLVK